MLGVVMGYGLDELRVVDRVLAEKLERVADKLGFRVVAFCESVHRDRLEKELAGLKIDRVETPTLGTLEEEISKTVCVVGFDSGPMHLASLRTATLTFLSHTYVDQWGSQIWHKQVSEKRSGSGRMVRFATNNLTGCVNAWHYSKLNCVPCHTDFCSKQECYQSMLEVSERELFELVRSLT